MQRLWRTCLLLLGAACVASGAQLYVSPGADPGAECSFQSPCGSFHDAYLRSAANDEVILLNGNYMGVTVSDTIGHNLTVRGEGAETTVFQDGQFIWSCSSVSPVHLSLSNFGLLRGFVSIHSLGCVLHVTNVRFEQFTSRAAPNAALGKPSSVIVRSQSPCFAAVIDVRDGINPALAHSTTLTKCLFHAISLVKGGSAVNVIRSVAHSAGVSDSAMTAEKPIDATITAENWR